MCTVLVHRTDVSAQICIKMRTYKMYKKVAKINTSEIGLVTRIIAWTLCSQEAHEAWGMEIIKLLSLGLLIHREFELKHCEQTVK